MTVTPLQIAIGGLALIVGLLAFAQRLGNWQNKELARVLSVIAAGLFVTWCFLLFPSWVGWLTATVLSSVCAWFLRTWTLNLARPDVHNPDVGHELESMQRELNSARAEVKRLTEGVDLLQSKLHDQTRKTHETDALLRAEREAHDRTRNNLKNHQTRAGVAEREAALLKLGNLTREMRAQSSAAPPSVKVQFIDWKASYSLADEIERIFTAVGWHVTKDEIKGSTLRNRTNARVVMESNTWDRPERIAALFNEGTLITQTAVASDSLQGDLEGYDLVVTVFP